MERVTQEWASTHEFRRWVRVGRTDVGWLWVHIDWNGARLSINGVEGPLSNGAALGSCGQCIEAVDKAARLTEPGAGIEPEQARTLAAVWRCWHLNDMKAGCWHQTAMGWDRRRLDESKPASDYADHGTGRPSWNLAMWAKRSEHPNGLLCEPCPVCGYRMGTGWKAERVPAGVVAFLASLPHDPAPRGWGWRG